MLTDAQLVLDGLTDLETDSNACGRVVVDDEDTFLIL